MRSMNHISSGRRLGKSWIQQKIIENQIIRYLTGERRMSESAELRRAHTPSRDSLVDAIRYSVDNVYRGNPDVSVADYGARSHTFPLRTHHAAVTLPRMEMHRMSTENEYVMECTMAIAGKLNQMMVDHLVRDCELEELRRFKDAILSRMRELNAQGEADNEPTTIEPIWTTDSTNQLGDIREDSGRDNGSQA